MIAVIRSPSAPAIPASAQGGPGFTWAAGKKIAPGFSLRDQNGSPISLRRFRGRPVILTFIDPRGYQRALYLFPFRAQDVEQTLRSLGRA